MLATVPENNTVPTAAEKEEERKLSAGACVKPSPAPRPAVTDPVDADDEAARRLAVAVDAMQALERFNAQYEGVMMRERKVQEAYEKRHVQDHEEIKRLESELKVANDTNQKIRDYAERVHDMKRDVDREIASLKEAGNTAAETTQVATAGADRAQAENVSPITLLEKIQHILYNDNDCSRALREQINDAIVRVEPHWLVLRDPYLFGIDLARLSDDNDADSVTSTSESIIVGAERAILDELEEEQLKPQPLGPGKKGWRRSKDGGGSDKNTAVLPLTWHEGRTVVHRSHSTVILTMRRERYTWPSMKQQMEECGAIRRVKGGPAFIQEGFGS